MKILFTFFLIFVFTFSAAQNCNIWLDEMAFNVKNNNTEEAIKSMKWFVNCKGNELGTDHQVIKNLETIEYISQFDDDGYALCKLKSTNIEPKYAIVNQDFTDISPLEIPFDSAVVNPPYADGRISFLCINKNDYYGGYIDRKGKVIIAPEKYNFAAPFKDGFARVFIGNLSKSKGKWGIIDVKGNEIIPLKYDYVSNIYDGFAVAFKGKKSILINEKNEEIRSYKNFEEIREISDGLMAAKLNGKWGYIDLEGKEIIPYIYKDAWIFTEGLAAVNQNGKWGYIDKTGKTIIPFQFDLALQFNMEKAIVEIDEQIFYIDKTGRCIELCKNAPADHP